MPASATACWPGTPPCCFSRSRSASPGASGSANTSPRLRCAAYAAHPLCVAGLAALVRPLRPAPRVPPRPAVAVSAHSRRRADAPARPARDELGSAGGRGVAAGRARLLYRPRRAAPASASLFETQAAHGGAARAPRGAQAVAGTECLDDLDRDRTFEPHLSDKDICVVDGLPGPMCVTSRLAGGPCLLLDREDYDDETPRRHPPPRTFSSHAKRPVSLGQRGRAGGPWLVEPRRVAAAPPPARGKRVLLRRLGQPRPFPCRSRRLRPRPRRARGAQTRLSARHGADGLRKGPAAPPRTGSDGAALAPPLVFRRGAAAPPRLRLSPFLPAAGAGYGVASRNKTSSATSPLPATTGPRRSTSARRARSTARGTWKGDGRAN